MTFSKNIDIKELSTGHKLYRKLVDLQRVFKYIYIHAYACVCVGGGIEPSKPNIKMVNRYIHTDTRELTVKFIDWSR